MILILDKTLVFIHLSIIWLNFRSGLITLEQRFSVTSQQT